jgi:methionyl-tRNA synthetase
MLDYNEIIEMLDWNNPPDVQKKGMELARQIKCLNVLVQPFMPGASKSLWENCAIVLCEKNDEELKPFVKGMFEWISDLNVPGAELIFGRLKRFKKSYLFDVLMNDAKTIAKAFNEKYWLSLIEEIEESVKQNGEE